MKSTIAKMLEAAKTKVSARPAKLRSAASARAVLSGERRDKPGIVAPKTLAAYERDTTAPSTAVDERLVAAAIIHIEAGLTLADMPADITPRIHSIAAWRLDHSAVRDIEDWRGA
jgi:hypothetical protein